MSSKVLLNSKEIEIILHRLACQLIENHNDFSNTVLIGLQPRGIYLANRLKNILIKHYNIKDLNLGLLDITFYRDDFRRREAPLDANSTEIDFLIENKNVGRLKSGDPYLFGRGSEEALFLVNKGIENFRNWGSYFNTSIALNNTNYSTRKPNTEDLALQKLFVIMQMTYLGAPMIYYGDEVGMWGGNDPDCRKPMLWDDIEFEDEVFGADGNKHEPDAVAINQDLFNHYKKLIQIRNQNIALQLGTYNTLLTDDEKEILIFERIYQNQKIIVVINNSDIEQTLHIPELKGKCFEDILNNKKVKNNPVVSSKWGMVLRECM